ncbi:MAG: NADH:ubiquinone oxidoreductase subunit 6 (subunit J) [Flavobacteriales bacterium]|jgi:NADH:ubiquinone oxidoreductase subunit 6 (subunit J)
MTDRWKYQIKTGGMWGFATATIISLFNLTDKSIEEEFLSKKYFIKLLYFILFGILIVGYFSWKKKFKKASPQALPYDHTLNK